MFYTFLCMANTKEKKIYKAFFVDPVKFKEFDISARMQGMSFSALLRQLIEEYLQTKNAPKGK